MLSWHFSPLDRREHDRGRAHYIPMHFGQAPEYYRRFLPPPAVVCLKTAPMDAHGYFNFGGACTYLAALAERARCLIVETSEAIPYVYGAGEAVHARDVDYCIEGDPQPITELPNAPPSEIDLRIAALVSAEIGDGACLQIGIGGLPNAICASLAKAGLRDLGAHSEMLVDGMLELWDQGILNGARKQIDQGELVFTFVAGSRSLYERVDRNLSAQARPVDYTNDPAVIARNDHVVSVNSAAQIDLTGQVASESLGQRHVSGTGGQVDFVRGAWASRGGKSFLCLPSTHEKQGVRTSRIVAQLAPGTTVTTPRSDVMYVATEFGCVCLKGRSVPERARALIGLAHPELREDLEREARGLGLLPRAFW
jgi:acyl-CoA hydrolase